MKAMVLAAGRGVRMQPLTERTPKAMLDAGGRPLIVHLIERLRHAGFLDLVINVSYLAEAIEAALGDGGALGVRITYSREESALETAGGIAWALPLLGAAPFVVANSDVYSDFDFARLRTAGNGLAATACLAHLVMVDNPAHHAGGDFGLAGGRLVLDAAQPLTFSGVGVYAPALFAGVARGATCALATLLRPAIARGAVSGEHHRGLWLDIGTPQRLAGTGAGGRRL